MLELLDKKIIVELDKNARQSSSQLAKKLRTSKNVVSYRINRLHRQGVISGYYTVVDTVKLGYHNYRLYVRFRNITMARREEIIKELVDDPDSWWVASTTRPWDVVVILLAQSVTEADIKVRGILRKFSAWISGYSLNRYVKLVHFPKDYLVDQDLIAKRHSFVLGDEGKAEISEMERQLLMELSYDAKAGTVKLAKKLKTTPAIAGYAIKKLIKNGVILGFRILLDYEKIGYAYHWIHIDADGDYGGLAGFVKAFPNTVYYDETLGGHSVEFAIQLQKEDDIHTFIESVLGRFGSMITDYSYFRVVKNHKVVYMPQRM